MSYIAYAINSSRCSLDEFGLTSVLLFNKAFGVHSKRSDDEALHSTCDMTHAISSQSSCGQKQVEPGLNHKDLSLNADDRDPTHKSRSLYHREKLIEMPIMPLANDTKVASNDSDTDDDEHSVDPSPLLSNAERKRVQNAVFEDFVRQKDETLSKDSSGAADGSREVLDDADSKGTTSARRIIDRVRDYQSELFARAKVGNIIAVLDTGSGKTLIAALLLREIVTQELEDRASGKSPRTSFFMVILFSHLYRV